MNISAVFLVAASSLISVASLAQNPSPPPAPPGSVLAPSALSGQLYPRYFPDGRTTYYLYAPDAKLVELGFNHNRPMQNDGKGNWTITTEPIGPGFHPYEFLVDGVKLCDPATQHFYDTVSYTHLTLPTIYSV